MSDEPQLRYKESRLVDCHDLDPFVAMHLEGYGVSWRALDTDDDGFHNGSYVTANVAFGNEIEDDEDQSFNRWLIGDSPFYLDPEGTYSYDLPGVQHMLQWLCNMDKIPDGRYVVEMW